MDFGDRYKSSYYTWQQDIIDIIDWEMYILRIMVSYVINSLRHCLGLPLSALSP